MKKLPRALVAVLVTAAAGFAAASIVTGKSLADELTGSTASTTSPTTTAPTTTGIGARRVTICHLTGSKKHPAVTITVSQSAVAAHLRHGDHLGACTGTEKPRPKHTHHHPSSSSSKTSSNKSHSTTNPGHSSGHGKGK